MAILSLESGLHDECTAPVRASPELADFEAAVLRWLCAKARQDAD